MTLKEELEILRGEPIQVFTGDPLDIPCIETSDIDRLCKHPVVSVHMITYNHEPYIRQAIEGVMMQKTDFEFELVIGEDCSTDKTREICFEYQKRYPDKIRVLWCDHNLHRNPHPAGGNGARNMAHCRGEFIALCEGDDYWIDPLKLQKQVDVMRKYPNVGFCFCGAKDYWQNTGETKDYNVGRDIPEGLIVGKDFIRYNVFGRKGSLRREAFVRTATSMVRVASLHEAREKCEILRWRLRLGDVPLWLSISFVSNVYFIADQVSTYRINDGGACARLGRSLWKDNMLTRIYFLFYAFETSEIKSGNLALIQHQYFWAVLDSNRENPYIKSLTRYFCQIVKSRRMSVLVDCRLIIWVMRRYLTDYCPSLNGIRKMYRWITRHGEFNGRTYG